MRVKKEQLIMQLLEHLPVEKVDFDLIEMASDYQLAFAKIKWLATKPTDVTGQPVIHNLPAHEQDEQSAARELLAWMRMIVRTKHLHRNSAMFGADSANTLSNKINREHLGPFRHLTEISLPLLFTETMHSSYRIPKILHDGAIYSSAATGKPARLTDFDKESFDHQLVFTAPFHQYSDSYIAFSIEELLRANPSSGVYFKMSDWVQGHSPTVALGNNISLAIHFHITGSYFRLVKTDDPNHFLTNLIDFPSSWCIYSGYQGLNEYLLLFVFKLLSLLPENKKILKDQIDHYFSELDKEGKLPDHLQAIMVPILQYAEFDYVNKIKLTFAAILKITLGTGDDIKHYDLTVLRKAIASDNQIAVANFFINDLFCVLIQNSYMLAKGIRDYAMSCHAKKVIAFLDRQHDLVSLLDLPARTEFALRTKYVYPLLTSPYPDAALYSVDSQLEVNGEIIHRHNHDIRYALLTASYVPLVIDYFKAHAKDPNFRAFCENMSPEKRLDIELDIETVMLFFVTGRGADLSHFDNPEKYESYRQQSVAHYEAFARSKQFSEEHIARYKALVLCSNQNFENDPEHAFLLHIVIFAHRLHLMRCYPLNNYLNAIRLSNDEVIQYSPKQQKHLELLFNIVTLRTKAVGGRLYCSYQDGQMTDKYIGYLAVGNVNKN